MLTVPFPPSCLATSQTYVAVASGSSIHLARPDTSGPPSSSKPPANPKIHLDSLVRHIAFSPDEQHLAALTTDKQLLIYALPSLEVGSSRTLSKRGAHLSFSPSGDVIVTDKVGDIYLYPREPRMVAESERPATGVLASDPSKNVDADLLLGHVSLITTHLLAPGGRRVLTADRDEHIRISRFPSSHVVEGYLFGSEGFVSALHIPSTRPSWLVSGGGEPVLRLWDLKQAKLLGTVDVSDVLLCRRVRSAPRKVKGSSKKRAESDPFYDVPEGWALPSGQGISIKRISSVRIGEVEVVLFFSQG